MGRLIGKRHRCVDCREPVPAGSPYGRCGDCQALYEAELADMQDEHAHRSDRDERELVTDGRTRPRQPDDPAPQRPYKQHWAHDQVIRIRRQHEQNPAGELDWNDLQAVQRSGNYAYFPPANTHYIPQRGHSQIGQSYPRPRRPRGMRQAGVDNNQVPGVIVNSGPDMALEAQRAGSTPGALPGGQRVYSGQLASNVPTLVNAEVRAVEQERRASDHAKGQGPSWRR